MKNKSKRNLLTVILSVLCAALIAVSVSFMLPKATKAQTAADLQDSSKTISISELTQENYNSNDHPNAVFDRDNLTELYKALTGGTGSTLQAVKNSVAGTTSYGSANTSASGAVTIPAYKSAYQLYTMNGNKNIVVDFGGQTWTVTFLTTDTSGDVIATLWLADGYKDGAGNYQKSAYGWNTGTSGSSAASVSATSYAASTYSSSLLRVKTLNGGDVNGGNTKYAWSTTGSATVAELNGTVSASDRVSNPWAIYTLNNTALSTSTKANKSLADYIDTPSQLKYTYYEDFMYNFARGGGSGDSYYFNEAITKDLTGDITGTAGTNTVKTTYGSGSGQYGVGWYNQTMYNMAYTNYTDIGYNDWAYDRIWIPSWSEVGSMKATDNVGVLGMWNITDPTNTTTAKTIQTGQLNAGAAYWTRSGTNRYTNFNLVLSASGIYAYEKNSVAYAVRPALHLNLTKAEGHTDLTARDITTTTAYDGTSKAVSYNGGQQNLGYLKPEWYIAKYYGDPDRVELTYEFIKQGDTTTAFKAPALGDNGITPSLVADPTIATNLVDAGKYKLTIKLKDNTLFWEDDELDYDTATPQEKEYARYKVVYFTIKQAEIKYKWKNIGLNSDWKVPYAQNFTPQAGASSAPWVYLDYTLFNADNTTTPSTTTTKIPYVVLKFTGSDAQFGDNVIDKIDNVRGGTTKGTNYPKHADTYTVTFEDKNKDTSNYKLVPDTSENATRSYTITRMEVTAPSAMTAKDYTGGSLTFSPLNGYDNRYMTYGTSDGITYKAGELPKNSEGNDLFSVDVVNTTGLSLSATDAGKYKLHYRLLTQKNAAGNDVVRDYKWKDASDTDPAPVKFVEYEIKPATLEFTFTSSASGGSWTIKANDDKGKLSFDYKTGKGPITVDGNKQEPVIEIYYYCVKDGEASGKKLYAGSASDLKSNELLFKDLSNLAGKHDTGAYKIVLALANSDTHAVNKNYALNTEDADSYTKTVTISAAEASLDDIKITYKTSLMGAGDDALELPASPDNLKYAYDKDSSKAVAYTFVPDFSDISFLEIVGNPTYAYADGSTVLDKAGKVTVTIKIKVKDSEKGDNKLPAQSAYTGTKFKTYTPDAADSNGNIYSATLTFEYEIGKADVDLSEIKYEYGYMNDEGKIEWVGTYDPENTPEFRDIDVYVRVKKPYVDGITDATIGDNQYTSPTRVTPGDYGFTVEYTLDDNHCHVKEDGTEETGTFKVTDKITLSKKKIPVKWTVTDFTGTDADGKKIVDDNEMAYQIYELDTDNPDLKQYVKYEYYLADMTDPLNPVPGAKVGEGDAGIKALINDHGAGKLENGKVKSLPIFIKMVIADPAGDYELSFTGDGDYQRTNLGEAKIIVYVEVVKDSSTYLDTVNADGIYNLHREKEDGALVNNYATVTIYPEGKPELSKQLADFDFATADAGKYTVKLELKGAYTSNYALKTREFTFTIEQKEIEAPQIVKDITFNSETQSLASYLDEKYQQYLDEGIISAVSGKATARNAGDYIAVIEIINNNYKWKMPADAKAESKLVVVKASVADEEVSSYISLDADKKQASYSWSIAPYKLGTDVIDVSGKAGAKINLNNLPDWVKTLISDGTLTAGIVYYADEAATSPLTEDEVVLKGGREYFAGVVLGAGTDGDDSKNFTFANDGTIKLSSTAVKYKVPQNGAAALMSNVKDFVTKTWLGLPVWAWFLVGLALIILLIIIIVIAKKRRKTKEIREEKKEKKEEEKRRREAEREAARAKQEAELELAKAKQEAELAKIRAAAGAAGMAGMAMQQQQPQQQAMPQQPQMQMQQPQQMPQPQMQQYPQQQQMPQQMPMMPMQMPMPQQMQSNSGNNYDNGELRELKSEIANMRAEQRSDRELAEMRREMELGFAKFRAENGMPNNNAMNGFANMGNNPNLNNADMLGAVLASMVRNLATGKPVELKPELELPHSVEESKPVTISAPTAYPADAVITTTTTVDTTNRAKEQPQATSQPRALKREPRNNRSQNNGMFDIDGFYDAFDENK